VALDERIVKRLQSALDTIILSFVEIARASEANITVAREHESDGEDPAYDEVSLHNWTLHQAENVFKFGLEGGPCAGKSTFLDYVQEKGKEIGVRIVPVPEVPTILVATGKVVDWSKATSGTEQALAGIFDYMVTMTRWILEQAYSLQADAIAENSPPIVLVVDRTILSAKSFLMEHDVVTALHANNADKNFDQVLNSILRLEGWDSTTAEAMAAQELEATFDKSEFDSALAAAFDQQWTEHHFNSQWSQLLRSVAVQLRLDPETFNDKFIVSTYNGVLFLRSIAVHSDGLPAVKNVMMYNKLSSDNAARYHTAETAWYNDVISLHAMTVDCCPSISRYEACGKKLKIFMNTEGGIDSKLEGGWSYINSFFS